MLLNDDRDGLKQLPSSLHRPATNSEANAATFLPRRRCVRGHPRGRTAPRSSSWKNDRAARRQVDAIRVGSNSFGLRHQCVVASACDSQATPVARADQRLRCPIARCLITARRHAHSVYRTSMARATRCMLGATPQQPWGAMLTNILQDQDIMGISEICYVLHVSRSQLFIWRRLPGFPDQQQTRHGHIGYSWRSVVTWMLANRHSIRWRAGRPALDVLAASIQP